MQLKANEVIKYLKYLVSVNDYNQIRKKKSNFNIPEKKNTHDTHDELSQTVLFLTYAKSHIQWKDVENFITTETSTQVRKSTDWLTVSQKTVHTDMKHLLG